MTGMVIVNSDNFNWRHAIRDLLEWSEHPAPDDIERLGMDQVWMVQQAYVNLEGVVMRRERVKGLAEVAEMLASSPLPWDFHRPSPERRCEIALSNKRERGVG